MRHAAVHWISPAALALAAVAGGPGTASAQVQAERIEIGRSSMGVPIEVIAIGEATPDAVGRTRDQRPALLIVAGIDGAHRVGVDAATALIDGLMADHAELLASKTVYVVPSLNPDGAVWLAGIEGRPAVEFGRTRVQTDADGDRRVGEDGADDLNGDGLITMMRVANPGPATGLTASFVADEDEPRLHRKATVEDGETPVYALLIEGIDNDNDGSFNEDGIGGTAGGGYNLDANFPSFWPDHREDAGLYPLDQPEARALTAWAVSRPNIAAVLVYDRHDNLLNTPKTGKFDETGRMPKGLEKDDEAYHKHVAEAFTEATGMTGAVTGDTAGSVISWVYSDLGLWAFSTPVWTRPDQVETEEEEGGEADAGESPDAEDAATPDAAAEAEADPQSEYDALIERGIPDQFARFLSATEEERATLMAEYESSSPEEQQAMLEAVSELPEDVRVRVMAIAGGGVDPEAPDEAGDDEAGGRSGKGGKDKKAKADEAELAWLKYSDEQRDGEGFVEWTEVEHPQLGTVEVGGFVPGFRVNPPAEELARLVVQQSAFVGELLTMLPEISAGDLKVEALGGGLHRVSLTVTNDSYLPTASAIGVKVRRIVPVVAVLEVPLADVIAGSRVQRAQKIDGSGGKHTFEWTVRADAPGALTATIRSGHFGVRTVGAGGGGDQ